MNVQLTQDDYTLINASISGLDADYNRLVALVNACSDAILVQSVEPWQGNGGNAFRQRFAELKDGPMYRFEQFLLSYKTSLQNVLSGVQLTDAQLTSEINNLLTVTR